MDTPSRHEAPSFRYESEAPVFWTGRQVWNRKSKLSRDQCVISGENFFVRTALEIPVVDANEYLTYIVWIGLDQATFDRVTKSWDVQGRENEPAYFGWVSNALAPYQEPTLNLKALVHNTPAGQLPLVELEPTNHPLAVEQRTGITVARVREIADLMRRAAK